MKSLRARLLALLVGLAATGLLLVGGVSYAALRDYLYDRVDRQAQSALFEFERRFDDEGPTIPDIGGPGHGFPGGDAPPDGPGPGGIPVGSYGALVDEYGHVIVEDTLAFRDKQGFETPKLPDQLSEEPVSADGFRVVARSLGNGTTLVAAVPLGELQDTLSRLVIIEVSVAAAVLAALAAAALWLVRLGLAPLERMGEAAGAIAAGDLSRRVEPATQHTEVGRLGLALNAMLGQIERAFAERTASEDRLRSFISDASHELRTPLASIRGYAELYRIGAARAPADLDKAMTRIEAEAARMGVLVEDLLTLARLDEEREVLREDVDLSDLARESVDAARAAAPDREITLDAGADVGVVGDADRLRQVLDNLIRNALTHTPEGTPVTVRIRQSDQGARPPDQFVAVRIRQSDQGARPPDQFVELEVADRGPGLPPGDPAALFERFWRAEGGRERGKAGAGLGLAIVAGIVDAHGGSVAASANPGGGARFVVSLPVA